MFNYMYVFFATTFVVK